MPLIPSGYQAPWFLRNGHVHTMHPVLWRRVGDVVYRRERLELDDGDFLDLDWSKVGGNKVVVVSHGLEGCSDAIYVKGMVRAFNRAGWDAVAWCFRGCSGEPNRLQRSYHSGATDDLWRVAEHAAHSGYNRVGLVGFSLGGNVTLKLLGERGADVPPWLAGGVGISVPCDLRASAETMARQVNAIYMRRFLISLRAKLRAKQGRFPAAMDDTGFEQIRTFRQFDDRYTAPLHGFRDAEDYWARCSARFVLERVCCPALLLNAEDDPFLAPECFPRELASAHPLFHLEIPPHGGHVGFVGGGRCSDEYFSERRAVEFLLHSN